MTQLTFSDAEYAGKRKQTRRGVLLSLGTMVDATIIHAPSSTKNGSGTRDPVMHQTNKGNQSLLGLKAHIGLDRDSGLVHTVVTTAANVNDVTQPLARDLPPK